MAPGTFSSKQTPNYMSETNVNQKQNILQRLASTAPSQIVTLPEVADRFMNLYSLMNGRNADAARIAYESEKFHFMKLLQDNPALQACTKLSLYGCFLDMAVQGLSFDPAMKHAYVVPFNVKVKDSAGRETWENRASLMIDGRGELLIRTRQGQIKHADNPVLVYEGDQFAYGTKNDRIFVDHMAKFPRDANPKIMACYLRIERPDGSVDYKVFGVEEVMALREFSKQKEGLMWTKGLPGTIATKTIKHAFKSYPKVKLGNFTQLKSDTIDPGEEPFNIDYGLDDQLPASTTAAPASPPAHAAAIPAPAAAPAAATPQLADDSFVEPATPPGSAQQGKVFHEDEF